MFKLFLAGCAIMLSVFLLCSCGDAKGNGWLYPTDEQVIADMTPQNDPDFLSAEVTQSGSGEAYEKGLQWFYDRGVVIKRKGDIAGAKNAVLIVGGLARYQLAGTRFQFSQFLTTYNEYKGLPAPDKKELTTFVENHLQQVFVSRDHNIFAVENIEQDEGAWTWHNANSFTVPFTIRYRERHDNTTIETRESEFSIRFYRKDLDLPLHALMATEGERRSVAVANFTHADIDRMSTLRQGFSK